MKIPLDRFVAIRKFKTIDRTKRNNCPASCILSLITADETHHSHFMTTTLDIEAPTKLVRNKFARAFARFLNIPLLEGDQYHMTTVDMMSVRSAMTPTSSHKGKDKDYVGNYFLDGPFLFFSHRNTLDFCFADHRIQPSSQHVSSNGFMPTVRYPILP